jgi:hypothetical protein
MRATFLLALLALGSLLPIGGAQLTNERGEALPPRADRDGLLAVHRYFHPGSRDHLLTIDPGAEASVVAREYVYEGIAFHVYPRRDRGLTPLYRFFKPSGGHFCATSRQAGEAFDAQLELLIGYIAEEDGPHLRPLHVWNNQAADRHFYTTEREGEFAPRAGYHYLGVLGYVVPARREE